MKIEGGGFSNPGLGLGNCMGSVAHPSVSVRSLLTHTVHLLPCLSNLAAKAFPPACPPDPDTITNTAQEASASSSGINGVLCAKELR